MIQDMRNFVKGKSLDPQQLFLHLSHEKQEHSKAVAELSTQMIEYAYDNEIYRPEEDLSIKELQEAIMYHDIGLVLIPDRIQNKIEPLTDAEYKVLSQHSYYGAKILENWCKHVKSEMEKKKWQLAAEIAISHHEYWNGKGYPYGLRATGVPIYVRAVTVADTFDSIRRGSLYRMPLPTEYALVEITIHSQKQFDPVFSDILVKIVNL